MKSQHDPESNRSLFSGPLAAHIGNYLARLKSEGYKRPTLYPDTLLLADLDAWMKRSGLALADVTASMLNRFLRHHMRSRTSRLQPKRVALRRLLKMLQTAV